MSLGRKMSRETGWGSARDMAALARFVECLRACVPFVRTGSLVHLQMCQHDDGWGVPRQSWHRDAYATNTSGAIRSMCFAALRWSDRGFSRAPPQTSLLAS